MRMRTTARRACANQELASLPWSPRMGSATLTTCSPSPAGPAQDSKLTWCASAKTPSSPASSPTPARTFETAARCCARGRRVSLPAQVLTGSLPAARCVQDGEQEVLENVIQEERIGRFGDSYGVKSQDWVKLNRESPSDSEWDDDSDTCSNVVLGARLEFITSSYGARVDLQHQIIGARLSFERGTWRYGQAPKQLYTVAVTFVQVPAESIVEFVPDAPTLFAPLPDDVFYPFTTATGAVQRRRAR